MRVRPGKGSRPRTRRRPAHEDAVDAFVTGVDRGRYRCLTGDRTVTAMKARELGRGGIVVGDRVSLAGDVSGEPGTLARVVRVQPRTSVLRRSAEDDDPTERIIVANADQLVIVTALANPTPRPRLIDRFLVAAFDAGLEPLLCLTKADLAAPDDLLAAYEPLGVRFDRAEPAVQPASSTSCARCWPGGSASWSATRGSASRPWSTRCCRTQTAPSARSARSPAAGRHTSSSAVALPLPGGGWIIDTPGLRSFGLGACRRRPGGVGVP